MRFVRRALLVAAVAAVTAGGAAAQTGGTGSSTSGTGGTLGTTGSTGGSTSSTGGSSSSTAGSTATPTIAGGNITATSSTATATGGGVDQSNFLGGTYSNPYYQGLYSNTTGNTGGFGTTLYSNGGGGGSPGSTSSSGTGASARTNANGRVTTTGGANPFGTSASPFGTTGRTGGGGGFGSAASSQFGGQVIALPRNIAYPAVVRFQAPAVAPAQRLADVQAVLSRSSMMTNPAGVSVVQDGSAFVLRGAVASEDEARLAENMVRMTPGVRDVRNELTFPKQ